METERSSVRLVRRLIQSKIEDMEVCHASVYHLHRRDYDRLQVILRALVDEEGLVPPASEVR